MGNTLEVSYSAGQEWLACEERYWLRYVKLIKPRLKDAAPELGTIIHDALDKYYKTGSRKKAMRTIATHRDAVADMVRLATKLGADDDKVRALQTIPATAEHLTRAFIRVRGRHDLETHKILMTEKWFRMEVKPGVFLPGKIDMVTQDDRGIWLWEHKTTGSIPKPNSRFRDLQTLVYRAALDELFDIQVDGIIWNYIRTSPPKLPAQLKNGKMSVRNMATTKRLVSQAIAAYKLDSKDYRTFLSKVAREERQRMFVRYTLPVAAKENILFRDYVHVVEQIQAARADPKYVPIRSIGAQCEWCAMKRLCQAAVLGGDTTELMQKYYTKGGKKDR